MNTPLLSSPALISRPYFTRFLPAAFCAALYFSNQSLHAATINVTSYGAIPNDGLDDTTAIQNAINASAIGDTVNFPTGTYNLANTVTFLHGRNYTGTGAILTRGNLGPNIYAVQTEQDNAVNMAITGLTFDSAGFDIRGNSNPANNVQILDCSFTNISQVNAVYDPIGASNCTIAGCSFSNGSGIVGWNMSSCSITDNSFNNIYEPMHINGVSPNLSILRNHAIGVTRIGIEIQCPSGDDIQNLDVEDNHFSHFVLPGTSQTDPYPYAYSIMPYKSTSGLVQYNTALGRPAVSGTSAQHYAPAFEIGGSILCQNNFSEGYWQVAATIGGMNATVTNNVFRGPTITGGYCSPTLVTLEPGSGGTETTSPNTQTTTSTYIENPDSLVAAVSGNRVSLTWADNSNNETGFAVERRVPGGSYATIATLPANTTSYCDEGLALNTSYVYRIEAFDNAGDLTYSPSVLTTTGSFYQFEIESLTVAAQTSTNTYRLVTDTRFSNDAGGILDSVTVGDYVTFDVPGLLAGNYDLRIGVKDFNSRGIWQCAVTAISNLNNQSSYVNHGAPYDEYNGNEVFTEVDLGAFTLGSNGDKAFRFTVTGKNTASSSYGMCFDYIKLIPQ